MPQTHGHADASSGVNGSMLPELCCARSSVGRWINWFTHSGIEGLRNAGFEHICVTSLKLLPAILVINVHAGTELLAGSTHNRVILWLAYPSHIAVIRLDECNCAEHPYFMKMKLSIRCGLAVARR